MPECTACHTKNEKGKFCLGCGVDLSKQTPSPAKPSAVAKFCGSCGGKNDGANFCMTCGFDLREKAGPASAPTKPTPAPVPASKTAPAPAPSKPTTMSSQAPVVNKTASQAEAEVMAELAAEKAQRERESAEYNRRMQEEAARSSKASTDAYLNGEAAAQKAQLESAWERRQAEMWKKAEQDEAKWVEEVKRKGVEDKRKEQEQARQLLQAKLADAKAHGDPCEVCRKIVSRLDPRVEFFNKHWHETCFSCAKCGVKMTPAHFVPDPVTEKCYCSPGHVLQQWG